MSTWFKRGSARVRRRLAACSTGVAALTVVVAITGAGSPAGSATASIDPHTLYNFRLVGSGQRTPNDASAHPRAELALVGSWSTSTYGVHFTGNTAGKRSGAYYRPTSGSTIQAPSSVAVGGAVRFRFQPPPSRACFEDSPNLTQIGRFAPKTGQLKIQLSSCQADTKAVYIECRVAGSKTSSSVLAVRNSAALADGGDYTARCVKSADPATGKAIVDVTVVRHGAGTNGSIRDQTFPAAPTGPIVSTQDLSVANKFPLPGGSHNTDQFVGDVRQVVYCQAPTIRETTTCLTGDLHAIS